MVKPLNRGFKMNLDLKNPDFSGKNFLICLIVAGISIGLFTTFELKVQNAETDLAAFKKIEDELAVFQNNTLIPILSPSNPEPKPIRKIRVVITAYSSSPWETDENPYITASGTWVREGIVANNLFPFGTKIRIPEIYGDKVFVVEDRMSWKKGNYHFDIWFPSYWEAKNFGAKRTYIEVLES